MIKHPLFCASLASALCLSSACSNSSSGTIGGHSGTNGASSGSTGTHTTGNGSGGASSSGGGLGSSCSAQYVCGTGLSCESPLELPGGICTVSCAGSMTCPSGGSCSEILPGEDYCLQSCQSDNDCAGRAGWGCDPTCKVCVPAIAEGQVACAGHMNVVGGGGHADGGGACNSLPPVDAGALVWAASVEASGSPLTIAEQEASLSSDGMGNLVVAYMTIPDAGPDAGSPFNWLGLATSTNDGSSFTAQPPIISAGDSELYDPTLTRDPAGMTYLVYAGINQAGTSGELYVTTSTDNGSTWTTPADVLSNHHLIDKPFVALNPVSNLPAVIFADIQGTSFPGSGSRVGVVADVSGGNYQAPIDVDTGSKAVFNDLATLAFDSHGNGYAAWIQAAQNGQNSVLEDQTVGTEIIGSTGNSIQFASFATSAQGIGSTMDNATVSASNESVVFDSARIAVSPDGNDVYVAYVVASGANATDIRVAASNDQGATWSNHTTVDDDPGCATHVHPALFIDSSGTLWVSWVDNRDGNGHVFYASSSDNASTFSENAVLSDQPFSFTTLINSVNAAVPGWLGAYQFLGGTSDELYSVWSADLGGVGPSIPAHVYFSKASLK